MALLVITKYKDKPELTAQLNGIDIPMVTSIVIESQINQFVSATIKVIVHIDSDGDGVMIENFKG